MHRSIAALLLPLFMVGCTAKTVNAPPSGPPSLYSDRAGDGDAVALHGQNDVHAGKVAVAVIGTPVYLALKAVVCGASLVVAAPTAAIIALSDSPHAIGVDKLGDGVATNCGPPYVLSPS